MPTRAQQLSRVVAQHRKRTLNFLDDPEALAVVSQLLRLRGFRETRGLSKEVLGGVKLALLLFYDRGNQGKPLLPRCTCQKTTQEKTHQCKRRRGHTGPHRSENLTWERAAESKAKAVLVLLRKGGPQRVSQLKDALGVSQQVVSKRLYDLKGRGLVETVAYGVWRACDAEQGGEAEGRPKEG